MEKQKTLFFLFQSSQAFEPTQEDLTSFQIKYKKDYKTRELYEEEELINEYRLTGWKHPRYAKIISFILAFEEEDNLKVKYISGEEKDVLQTFSNILRKSQEYNLVSYNTKIVLPFIGIRSRRNDILTTPHRSLVYNKGVKPYEVSCTDLQQYYDGSGSYRSSIKDIAEDLKLNHSNVLEIEDEFTYYNSNDFGALKNSAIQKVEIIANSYRILNDFPPLATVLVEEQVKDVQEEKPTNFLEILYRSQAITLEVRGGLETILKKKKLTKRDREIVREIILGVYVQNDFINGQQDSKATIEKKTKEVETFLATI